MPISAVGVSRNPSKCQPPKPKQSSLMMKVKLYRAPLLCLALVFAFLLVGCGGAEQRKAEHYKKAVHYFDQQNYDKATVEFKNVLQIDPKLAKAYFYLGRIEESKKNWREAFGLYQKSVELDPSDSDSQLKLAQFWLLASDIDKAAELLTSLSKDKPSDMDVRLLRVAIANRKGDAVAALTQVEKIVAEKPPRPEPYIVLAALYSQQAKLPEAERVLKTALATLPNNLDLLTATLRFYQQQKMAGPAEQTVKKLIEIQPEMLSHRILLAQIYMDLGQVSEVEQVLHTAMKKFPNDPTPPLVLAEFFFRQGEKEKAENELKAAIASRNQEVKLQLALATLYEQTKRPAEAEKMYRDFIGKTDGKSDALKVENALAALLARLGRLEESNDLLTKILKYNPQDHDALLLQGRLALAKGDSQNSISSFRTLLKDQPESPAVLTLLADAYLMDGKLGLAQENLEMASAVRPLDFSLRKNLVDFLLRQNNHSLALEKIDEFVKLDANSIDGAILKSDVLTASGKAGQAEALLKEIRSKHPENALAPMRLGGFYLGQTQYDAAIKEYEAALKLSADGVEPLRSIAGTYLLLKQPGKALARVKKAIAENPKNAGNHLVMGILSMDLGQAKDAEIAFKDAITSSPRWLSPYLSLGTLYEKQGHPEQAIETYSKAIAIVPQDSAIRFNLARAFEAKKENGKAIEQYEIILQEFPGNTLATNNLASVLSLDPSDKAKLNRAFELAKGLEYSGQPVFLDTLAWIYYLEGDVDHAISLQSKVIEKMPNIPVFEYHLGMMYYKNGDTQKALDFIKKALLSKESFSGLEDAGNTLRILEDKK